MPKGRVYTQEQYDSAVKRISKVINIEEIKNIQELDRKLKKENLYHDSKGGLGTIYEQLVENWKQHVEPDQLIAQEKMVLRAKKKPALSKRAIRIQRRQLNRIQGITYLRNENKIKIRKVQGEVRQYILHQGNYHNMDNIIVYNRTTTKKDQVVQKWHTRRKPKRKTPKSAKSAKKE